jgi:hypothetical protein
MVERVQSLADLGLIGEFFGESQRQFDGMFGDLGINEQVVIDLGGPQSFEGGVERC